MSELSFVYALVDPRNDEIRYIGVTTNPVQRFRNHLFEAKQDTKTHKRAWIRSLALDELEPVFSVILDEVMETHQLLELEIEFIAQYRAEGHNLTNITDGGEGAWGFSAPRTEEWCRKLSEAKKRYDASTTDEDKKARAEKRLATILQRNNGVYPGYTKGKPHHNRGGTLPEETKQKMKEAHKRRWDRIRAEGRYEEVCANISAGTKRAYLVGDKP